MEGDFISSLSGAFCYDCTRMRLSADGKKYTCYLPQTALIY
ncbi:hypothetical protein P4U23_04845 [Aeribacillus composti]|nr:hypothetical protein [Aeribacillus composti]